MIYIGAYLKNCPQVWINYINAVNPTGKLTNDEVDEITLKEWKGTFTIDTKGPRVEFATPYDELKFYLCWS
jgi:hypothetical protein